MRAPALLAAAVTLTPASALAFGPLVELTTAGSHLRSADLSGARVALAEEGQVEIFAKYASPTLTFWFPFQTLTHAPTDPGNVWGRKVALHDDRLAILESGGLQPIVHVLELSSTTFQYEEVAAFPPPPGSTRTYSFGSALALEGDTLVVGHSNDAGERGKVFVYLRGTDGTWALIQTLEDPRPSPGLEFFGAAAALAQGRLAVGAPGAAVGSVQVPGRVYVYARTPSGHFVAEDDFAEPGHDVPDNGFGAAVAYDGTYLTVRSDLRHYVYRRWVTFGRWSPIPVANWSPATPWDVAFAGPMAASAGRLLVGTGGAYGLDAAVLYDLAPSAPAFVHLFYTAGAPGLGGVCDFDAGRAFVGAGGWTAHPPRAFVAEE